MSNFQDELRRILEDDPLGILDVKPANRRTKTADERLVASFREINAFVVVHGREPEQRKDIAERRLYSRLKGLRESPDKAEQLMEHDTHGLLAGVRRPEAPVIETIEDVLEQDALGLLDSAESDVSDIFRLTNVPEARSAPDLVAKRKVCDEFETFEPLFKQCHADLKSGVRTQVPFGSERQITPGSTFVLHGMLVYVANVGKWEKKNFGKDNARLYCVFENGTESNMFLRSLAAALWKDSTSRQVIEASQAHLFAGPSGPGDDDEATGHIYILRSHSTDPRIESMEHLYKIGFSSQAVDVRTKNATKEPTYLMADVSPVTTFQTFNLNPQKLEFLVHKFFASARLDLDVYDEQGQRHMPREWFVVPLHVIEAAVKLLISGEILNYRYDATTQAIVSRIPGGLDDEEV